MTSAPVPATAAAVWRRLGMITMIGLAVAVLDVLTKTLAANVFANDPVQLFGGRLVLNESRNPGATFGLATSATPVLALIAAGAVTAVLVYARRRHTVWVAVILGLGLGGATGNLIDRLFRQPGPLRGHVVDWIDLGWWPSFNLADVSICSAVALAVIASIEGPSSTSEP